MKDGGQGCLFSRHPISYDTTAISLLSMVHCVYDYKMDGATPDKHWEVLESRIMDVWQAGKKVGWIHSLIWGFAFLGYDFQFGLRIWGSQQT